MRSRVVLTVVFVFAVISTAVGLGISLLPPTAKAAPNPPVSSSDVAARESATNTMLLMQTFFYDLTQQQAFYAVVEQQAATAAANARAAQQTAVTSTPTPVQQQAAPVVSSGGGSGTWEQLAICEEDGQNSPSYGYFGNTVTPGIGSMSMAQQEQIALQLNGGSIPYAPAGCAAAGYRGW